MTAAHAPTDPPAEPRPFREVVAAELRAHAARQRISNRRLAKLLDTTPAWVDRRMNGTTAIDTDDLARFAQALGLEPMELLADIPFRTLAPQATSRRPRVVTGTGTGWYYPECSPRRPALHLVSDTADRYPGVHARNGSSAREPGQHASDDPEESSTAVNHADAA